MSRFSANKGCRGGRSTVCKDCMKRYPKSERKKQTWTPKQLARRNAKFRAYYLKTRERRLALAALNRDENRERNRLYQRDAVRGGNPPKYRSQDAAYRLEYRRTRRLELLARWGAVCVRCGFDDVRALHIDHVNGGGRKESRSMSATAYRRHLLAAPKDNYQVLCANCNSIKRIENGEHRPPTMPRAS